jgi:DNA polymerase V
MPGLFALVDCNNFYASCERLFAPRLMGKPVVVLSNNDGCIIARSNEAKALGIAMGAPYFKWEKFLQAHGVAVFSSNYALYGDISRRVMALLKRLEPAVEVYSIDEAFLRLSGMPGPQLTDHGRRLAQTVRRWTGIPVSIGIGPTKTLAKVAGRLAKKNETMQGVFDITGADTDEILGRFPVADVWGIGRRQAARLALCGVTTALDLKNCGDEWLRRTLSITGLRTAMELRGISCLNLEECPVSRKSIASSKSFGYQVEALAELKEALATYLEQAAVKLRGQHALAGSLEISLATNRFSKAAVPYSAHKVITLPEPTACTTELLRHALPALADLYRPGLRYQKAGVVLFGLVPASAGQPSLFAGRKKQDRPLMAALDRINARWGRSTIQHGAAGLDKPWRNRQQRKSPAYTTSWQELPVVKA